MIACDADFGEALGFAWLIIIGLFAVFFLFELFYSIFIKWWKKRQFIRSAEQATKRLDKKIPILMAEKRDEIISLAVRRKVKI